jgi:hypothetical protein
MGLGDCPDFCVSKNGTVPFAGTGPTLQTLALVARPVRMTDLLTFWLFDDVIDSQHSEYDLCAVGQIAIPYDATMIDQRDTIDLRLLIVGVA